MSICTRQAKTSLQALPPNWSNQLLHTGAKGLLSECVGRSHRCRLSGCQTEIKRLLLTQLACEGGQTTTAGIPASNFPSYLFNDGHCKMMWSWKSGQMWGDLLGKGEKKDSNKVNQWSVVIAAICIEIVDASVCTSQPSASVRACLGGLPWGTLVI